MSNVSQFEPSNRAKRMFLVCCGWRIGAESGSWAGTVMAQQVHVTDQTWVQFVVYCVSQVHMNISWFSQVFPRFQQLREHKVYPKLQRSISINLIKGFYSGNSFISGCDWCCWCCNTFNSLYTPSKESYRSPANDNLYKKC